MKVPKLFWLINGMKDSTEFELLMKDASIATSDLMEVFYSQAFHEISMHDNSGETCMDVYAEYDPAVKQGSDKLVRQVGSNICLGDKSSVDLGK